MSLYLFMVRLWYKRLTSKKLLRIGRSINTNVSIGQWKATPETDNRVYYKYG